jgi:uncharacterized delta-60 repeat protein
VIITLSLALLGEGAPGDLDPTFGVGGKVTTDFFGGLNDLARALVLQPDGKLVAAGQAEATDGRSEFALARYLPDGSLDPTFGVGGKVTTDFGGQFDLALALVLQPDSKLVAAGLFGGGNFALARYLPDGSLDPTFGVGGTVISDFEGELLALALQPDGKLVAAGGSAGSFALARYLPDGSLDPTFGVGGTVTTDFTNDVGGVDAAHALALQPDGKLVAAGGSAGGFALARYLPDGHLDATFGVGGKVITDFGGAPAGASALALQPDGKLVAAGSASPGFVADFALARYLPDGRLDPTFGTEGKVTTDFRGLDDVASALVLQPDGKLVAAGSSPSH